MSTTFLTHLSIFLLFFFLFGTIKILSQQLTPVRIGNQVWARENLQADTPNSWCYQEKEEYCASYGRLYTWDAARQACPAGWHLPTQEEWKTLIETLGGEDQAAEQLANPASGFNLKYGGMARIGNYMLIDSYCAFWTASAFDKDHAWYVFLTPGNNNVTLTYFTRKYGFSVRCIKD